MMTHTASAVTTRPSAAQPHVCGVHGTGAGTEISASFSSAARVAGSSAAVASAVAVTSGLHVEGDLLDPPGEGEVTLALVVRAGRRNRVPADLERLDPVAGHRHVDGSLADELAVREQLHRRPVVERAARFQAVGRVLQLDGHLPARKRLL